MKTMQNRKPKITRFKGTLIKGLLKRYSLFSVGAGEGGCSKRGQ
jgi:hypothetical protein